MDDVMSDFDLCLVWYQIVQFPNYFVLLLSVPYGRNISYYLMYLSLFGFEAYAAVPVLHSVPVQQQ